MRSEPDNTSSPARFRLGFGGKATRPIVPEEPLRVAGTSDVTYSTKSASLTSSVYRSHAYANQAKRRSG
jgi:hypothetical protein